jgi:hypothetical protein
MYKILFIVSVILILSGCGESSALDKLKSNSRFEDMNNSFWAKEHDANSSLWHEAIVYCKDHNEKPNCDHLMQVYVITNGSTEVPAYGTSGNTLTTPDFT